MSEKRLFQAYSGSSGAEKALGAFLIYVNRLPHFLHFRKGRSPIVCVLRFPLAIVRAPQYTHLIGLPRAMCLTSGYHRSRGLINLSMCVGFSRSFHASLQASG